MSKITYKSILPTAPRCTQYLDQILDDKNLSLSGALKAEILRLINKFEEIIAIKSPEKLKKAIFSLLTHIYNHSGEVDLNDEMLNIIDLIHSAAGFENTLEVDLDLINITWIHEQNSELASSTQTQGSKATTEQFSAESIDIENLIGLAGILSLFHSNQLF